jgi:ABC-type multidrug transport system fused ATPase/permease subunit
MTTVVIAHRLQTVRNADCIVVLNEGSVAEKGSHRELMGIEDGIYSNMVNRAGTDFLQ